MIILKAAASGDSEYEEMWESDINWLLDDNNTKIPDFVEKGSIDYFDWAQSTMFAEACLLLAKKLGDEKKETRSQLIEAGIRYAEMTEKSLKDADGNIVSDIAYSSHSSVLAQLESPV